MATERELKFSLLDDHLPSAAELEPALAAGGLRIVRSERLHQRDRYYDDPLGSLAAAGVALRRRSVGGARLAGLKTRGEVDGAFHRREEIELPLVGSAWPPAVTERLAACGVADPAALESRVLLACERQRHTVARGERPIAQLCLDRVEARYPQGDQTVHFEEVEIEALDGATQADLEAIAERLDGLLAMSASTSTKLERANALLAFGAELRG